MAVMRGDGSTPGSPDAGMPGRPAGADYDTGEQGLLFGSESDTGPDWSRSNYPAGASNLDGVTPTSHGPGTRPSLALRTWSWTAGVRC